MAIFGLLPPATGLWAPGVIFPPLGNETTLAQFFTVIFAAATTYLVYWMKDSIEARLRRRMVTLLALAIFLFCAYLGLHFRFVKKIEIPTEGKTVFVSVGYERSQFAPASFDGEDDAAMLRARGFTEEEITKLWTPRSVYFSRLALVFSFIGTVLLIVAFASIGILLRAKATLRSAAKLP